MTYSEYLQDPLKYDPTPEFANIPNIGSTTFGALFRNRYDRRTTVYHEVKKFGETLHLYAVINSFHFSKVIAAYNKANAAILADFEKSTVVDGSVVGGDTYRQFRNMAPANGNEYTGFVDGQTDEHTENPTVDTDITTTETANDPDTADKVAKYAAGLANLYMQAIESFEPLFLGVI